MSNWKKYPNLFANGKFKLKAKSMFGDYNVIDFDCTKDVVDIFPDDKLIARPISDMTDEEGTKFVRMMGFDNMTYEEWGADKEDFMWSLAGKSGYNRLQQMEKFIQNYTPATLEALSIGVYCLPDTTDVIFRGKNDG